MLESACSVRVTSGARLHFGLLDTRAPFGGVGVMVDRPLTQIRVSLAERFDPGDVQPERITQVAARFAEKFQLTSSGSGRLPGCCIRVVQSAEAHRGLGSGTQLSLAVARGLAELYSLSLSRTDLVESFAGRGLRSAVGSLGFFEGGLIFEHGLTADYQLGDSCCRVELPNAWRVVLAEPLQAGRSISGQQERQAFAQLPRAAPQKRRGLTQLAMQIVQSGQRGDFKQFAAAVSTFNRRSGELFRCWQGGCFNGPAVTGLIEQLHGRGAVGCGQSSWGPTVFAVCPSAATAADLCQRLQGIARTTVVALRQRGATVDMKMEKA